jgi:hypothetical protein
VSALEQVAQPDVSEAALGLGRSRRENAQSPRAHMLDAEPERRLPDARVALEHECSGPSLRFVDEDMEAAKFLLPADDLEHHPPR